MINEAWAVFWAGLYVLRNTRGRDALDYVCIFLGGWCFLMSRDPSDEVVNAEMLALACVCASGPMVFGCLQLIRWVQQRLE